jgi:hypothetical protein
MDARDMGWYGMDLIDLARERDKWRAVVKILMKLRVPLNIGKFLGS